MINQLKQIYPTLIVYNQKNQNALNKLAESTKLVSDYTEDYTWFLTDDEKIIGISKSDLTKKDIQLLSTFLHPFHTTLSKKTPEEQQWYERIHKATNESAKNPFRFVFFALQKHSIQPEAFKNALDELFNKVIPIIWLNKTEGIIVEEILLTEEKVNYEQIIDILMADLSVKIKFFIGNILESYNNLQNYYSSLINSGKMVFRYSDKMVIHYIESIPYLLLHNLEEKEINLLVSSVLKHFHDDEEMIKTVQMYLKNNLNVSETAKQLYMHRNSLQYRIDKFTNETDIQIQHFDQALAVQLAILAKKIDF